MKQLILFITCLCVLLISAGAQTPPAIQWQHSIGGTNNDNFVQLQRSNDGGYILGLDFVSYDVLFRDFVVMKLNVEGSNVWEKSIPGILGWLSALQQTSDNSYILGASYMGDRFGNGANTNFGLYDFWLLKLDEDGDRLWEKSFGGSNYDYLTTLQQTTDGGYIFGGYSKSGASGNKTSTNYGVDDIWIIKVDSGGNKVWENSFGGSNSDTLSALQQTSDGGYILGGLSSSGVSGNKTSPRRGNDDGSTDCWLIKLNSSGSKVWENTYGGMGGEGVASLRETSDGGYIFGGTSSSGSLAGQKTSPSYGFSHYWVVKVNSNGSRVWDKSFGGSYVNQLTDVRQLSDGGYLVSGYSSSTVSGNKTSPHHGEEDYWVIRLDDSGNKIWEKSFGGSGSDTMGKLLPTSDGGYILGGSSSSEISGNKTTANSGKSDVWLIKLEGLPAPSVFSVTRTNSLATLKWTSISNYTYRVQVSTNLGTTNWQSVAPDIRATNTTASGTVNTFGNPRQFYRIQLSP